jgi:hypothetical protein
MPAREAAGRSRQEREARLLDSLQFDVERGEPWGVGIAEAVDFAVDTPRRIQHAPDRVDDAFSCSRIENRCVRGATESRDAEIRQQKPSVAAVCGG